MAATTGGATGPEGMDHQLTAIIAGGVARVAFLTEGVQKRFTFSIATSGTRTTWTFLCPGQGSIVYGYDAAPSWIVLYITSAPSNLRTFTLTRQ